MYEIYRQCAGIYDFGVTYEHAADFERQQSCFSVHACLGPTTTLNATLNVIMNNDYHIIILTVNDSFHISHFSY